MSSDIKVPTPYPEVNALLRELLAGIRAILGDGLVGMYLDGSLANGGFDADSDIDFVAVCDAEIQGDRFAALQAMHDRIAATDSVWATQLEGSYLSARALRRFDPANCLHPNIERGMGERLKMIEHGEEWDVHRYILRKSGITLAGPAAQTLIDPVSPDQLRRGMHAALSGWATGLLKNPARIGSQGYQSYIVLSQCRILYTLANGDIVSKQDAARWAQSALHPRWSALIERAPAGRRNPAPPSSPAEVAETLEMLRYTLERSREYER